MRKKLLTYITGDILVKGLSFLMLPFFSHLINPSEYGVLGLLSAIVAFMPAVLTLSYITGFVRFSIDTDENILISTFVFLGTILNLIYFFLALLVYETIVYRYDIPFKYYFLAIVTSVVVFIFHILLVYFQSISNAKAYMRTTVFYGLLGIILNLIFVLAMDNNIAAMLIANFINTLIIVLFALNYLRKKIFWDDINFTLAKEILLYTSPLTLGAIGLLVFSQMDKIVLTEYIDKGQLGIYTMALSISLAISYLGRALFISYQPTFLELANKNNKLIIKRYPMIILFILASMILTFFAIIVIYQFIDSRYYDGLKIALINTMAYTFLVFARIMELHLSYKKRSNIIALVYGVGGIVTILLLYIFIPHYGMIGASYALYISGLIISIFMYIFAQKYFYLEYPQRITVSFYLSLCLSLLLVYTLV